MCTKVSRRKLKLSDGAANNDTFGDVLGISWVNYLMSSIDHSAPIGCAVTTTDSVTRGTKALNKVKRHLLRIEPADFGKALHASSSNPDC